MPAIAKVMFAGKQFLAGGSTSKEMLTGEKSVVPGDNTLNSAVIGR
jgi:hypothetical protein